MPSRVRATSSVVWATWSMEAAICWLEAACSWELEDRCCTASFTRSICSRAVRSRSVAEREEVWRLASSPPASWVILRESRDSSESWATRSAMRTEASWLSPASLRTSSATTAKPRPESPARAASMAALRARRFVWSAMPRMVSTKERMDCEAPSTRATRS